MRSMISSAASSVAFGESSLPAFHEPIRPGRVQQVNLGNEKGEVSCVTLVLRLGFWEITAGSSVIPTSIQPKKNLPNGEYF